MDNSENLSGRLAKRGLRVTNLGQGGNGPLLELAILREYGLRLHAKNVVWVFFCGNDFVDLEFEKGVKAFSMQASSTVDTDLAARRQRTDKAWVGFVQSRLQEVPRVKRSNVWRFLRLARTRTLILETLISKQPQRAPQEDVDLIASIVRTAKTESEAAGSVFTFVYLPPVGAQADLNALKQDGAAVMGTVAASGIRVVDFGATVRPPRERSGRGICTCSYSGPMAEANLQEHVHRNGFAISQGR